MKEIFFETFFSLVRLFLDVKDDFLQEKLAKKTKEFFEVVSKHVAQSDFTTSRDVAKSDQIVQHVCHVAQSGQRLLKVINDINELVEILIHLKLVSLSPALSVQKNLLRFKTEILDSTLPKTKKGKTKADPKNSKDNYSSQKLVDYLKTKPAGAQAVEIARHFAKELSRRTVQRYLNELVSSGLIKKDRTDGFPKYFLL